MTIMRRYTTAGWEDVGISSLLVTTDTTQTVTGIKTFSSLVTASQGLNLASGKKLDFDPLGQAGYMMAEAVNATTFTDSLAGDTVFRESNTGRQHFGTATSAGAAQASMMMISDTGVAIGRGVKSFGGGSGVLNITDATTVPTNGATSGVIIYGTGGRAKLRDQQNNVWNLDSSALYRTTVVTPNSTTTSATIAGLTATLGTGTYAFECNGYYTSAATTTGMQLSALMTSGTATGIAYGVSIATGTAAVANGATITANTKLGSATVGPAATMQQFQMTGTVVVSVSGIFAVQFNSGVASSAVTPQVGSYLRITRIA